MEALHAEDPSRELFFLIGADSLVDLPGWREPERICELAHIVAVNRGSTIPADPAQVARGLSAAAIARIRQVTMPGIDLSATDIRRRVRSGQTIRFMVPRAVEVYIQQHSLYRN